MDKLTVLALKNECKKRNIKNYSKLKKQELIDLLSEKDNKKENYKVISLFTGIGGMDYGFSEKVVVHKKSVKEDNYIEKANNINNFVELTKLNFDIVFQNDILKGAKEICEYNNIAYNYIIKSIYDLLNENYIFPEADVITGGFPCQPFSHSGKREGFNSSKSHDLKIINNDEKDNEDNNERINRGTLYKCYVNVVQKVKPKIFIAENVYGLLTMKDEPIKQIIKDFSDVGYDVKYQLICCNEFGIPQTRKRVIIIGINKDRKNKNLDENWNIINENKITCNIGNYFEHLQEPDNTEDISQQMYSKAKRLEKGQGQIEVNLKGFAPTMRAEAHGNIEFRRYNNSSLNNNESNLPERRLTVREAGLIQTFPPEFIFNKKKVMTPYKYIGNAVPPLLSYLIANKVQYLIETYF